MTFTWADLGESSDFGPVNRVVDVQEQRRRSLLSNWTGTLPEDDYPRVKVMGYKKRGGYESLKWWSYFGLRAIISVVCSV